ncbi:DNA replication complex subunit Gins51 [Natronoarchaeum rubrum]|uniref:DNA replication complex subunit Gins51 n=1 Tax=Natronoarchaeum rubrum TaxID=755311 RepID=UPI002113352E|nr:hypothetical protein [Natronoarchaeum rubrum]
MNLDDLRSVQSKERQKDSLQHLRDSFYEDVGEYVAELKDERDRAAERAEDPFSSEEVGRLTDKIETAEEVVEAIYERRMGKLVKRASLAAAGMPSDEEGLTAEEQDLFEDLVDRIETNKAHVLDVLSGDVEASAGGADAGTDDPTASDADAGAPPSAGRTAPPSSDAESQSPDAEAQPPDAAPPPVDGGRSDADDADSSADRPTGEASSVSAADLMGGGDEPAEGRSPDSDPAADSGDATADDVEGGAAPSGSAAPSNDGGIEGDAAPASEDGPGRPDTLDEDRTTVRITKDVGEIFGVDEREYELTAEDVVTLPETNAEPLIERDAAERLD